MKKYIEPSIKIFEVENSEMLIGSINNEKGNGAQLSKEIIIDEDDDNDEDLW